VGYVTPTQDQQNKRNPNWLTQAMTASSHAIRDSSVYSSPGSIGGRATLKMLRRKSKTQSVQQERNMQNAIALLNYLKPMTPQQKILKSTDATAML
jgi:hypothetical protein